MSYRFARAAGHHPIALPPGLLRDLTSMSRLSGFVPASSRNAIEASEQMESAGVLSNSSEAFSSEAFSGAALGRQVDTVSKRISPVMRKVFVKCGLMASI